MHSKCLVILSRNSLSWPTREKKLPPLLPLARKQSIQPTEKRDVVCLKKHTHTHTHTIDIHIKKKRMEPNEATKNIINNTEEKKKKRMNRAHIREREREVQERYPTNVRERNTAGQISVPIGRVRIVLVDMDVFVRPFQKSFSFSFSPLFFDDLSLCTTNINSKFAIFQKFIFKYKIVTFTSLPSLIVEKYVGALERSVCVCARDGRQRTVVPAHSHL